jgi:hypothetical protein
MTGDDLMAAAKKLHDTIRAALDDRLAFVGTLRRARSALKDT